MDYYFGACESGGGAAISILIGMLGYSKCCTVCKNASRPDPKEIQGFVDSGKIAFGIDDTGIKAGVIGEVAGEADRLTESETKVLSAAARAGAHCGCAVTTHCQMGKMGLEQSALLQKNGQNPEKIVLGHLDLANDMEYYREVLKTGVNIAFDTCGKIAYLADEIRADNLCRLLDEGWGDHIMLSNDISRKSYLTANGKFGYAACIRPGRYAVFGTIRRFLAVRAGTNHRRNRENSGCAYCRRMLLPLLFV